VIIDDEGRSVLPVGDSTSALLDGDSICVQIVDESKVVYFGMRALVCF
jgi:hypothetical protein